MYLRLGFSIAIHSSAEILLIDEILAVGDELFQQKCIEKLKSLKGERRTMIVISHDRLLLNKIADRIIYFKNGEQTEEQFQN